MGLLEQPVLRQLKAPFHRQNFCHACLPQAKPLGKMRVRVFLFTKILTSIYLFDYKETKGVLVLLFFGFIILSQNVIFDICLLISDSLHLNGLLSVVRLCGDYFCSQSLSETQKESEVN